MLRRLVRAWSRPRVRCRAYTLLAAAWLAALCVPLADVAGLHARADVSLLAVVAAAFATATVLGLTAAIPLEDAVHNAYKMGWRQRAERAQQHEPRGRHLRAVKLMLPAAAAVWLSASHRKVAAASAAGMLATGGLTGTAYLLPWHSDAPTVTPPPAAAGKPSPEPPDDPTPDDRPSSDDEPQPVTPAPAETTPVAADLERDDEQDRAVPTGSASPAGTNTPDTRGSAAASVSAGENTPDTGGAATSTGAGVAADTAATEPEQTPEQTRSSSPRSDLNITGDVVDELDNLMTPTPSP